MGLLKLVAFETKDAFVYVAAFFLLWAGPLGILAQEPSLATPIPPEKIKDQTAEERLKDAERVIHEDEAPEDCSFADLVSKTSPKLSLNQAVLWTVKYNESIKMADMQILMLSGAYQHLQGPFDPQLDGTVEHTYSRDVFTNDGIQNGMAGHQTIVSLTGTKQSRLGTLFTLNARLNHHIVPSAPDVLAQRLNTGAFSFQIVQPLLQDFLFGLDAMHEEAAAYRLEAGYWEQLQAISQAIHATAGDYWSWVAAQAVQENHRVSIERVKQLIHDGERLIELGVLASSELTQVLGHLEVLYYNYYIDKQATYMAFENLKDDMGIIEDGCCGLDQLFASEDFPEVITDPECITKILKGMTCYASQYRFTIIASGWRIHAAYLDWEGARNHELPELDVFGGVEELTILNEGAALSLGRPWKMEHPETSWNIGVTTSIPFYNDGAIGTAKERAADYYQARLQREQLRQNTVSTIRTAVVAHLCILKELRYSKEAIRYYEETYNSQLKVLETGYGSLFQTVQYSSLWTTAVNDYIDALTRYWKNINDLRFFTSTSLYYDDAREDVTVQNLKTLPFDVFSLMGACDGPK